jgi:cellulose synthase/poly-beta-1,6-N-acetylglucosamine synthase-like glycosyltransferase
MRVRAAGLGAASLTHIVAITCGALIAIAAVHLIIGIVLAVRLKLRSAARVDEGALPRAAVILSLRGRDRSLGACLEGLVHQDYPDYSVEIVVDSDRDPAWQAVHRILTTSRSHHVRVRALESPARTCSLKCSALVQAVSALDESHEVLAFIDADVIPHPTWLRELVTPLLEIRVGATTGNRWYAGRRRLFGSQARAAWNAAAVAQMSLFGMPWGGTLAIRRETFDAAGLLSKWSRSFNDDIVLGEEVSRLGLEMRFVPSLLMVESGESPIQDVRSFVFRELMHLKFYLGAWPVVSGFGILTTLLAPVAFACLWAAIARGDWEAALWSGGGIAAFMALLVISYWVVESAVVSMLRKNGRLVERLGLRALWAAPLAVCMFTAALLPALVRRTVNWRGVGYRISQPWQVELLHYRPASGEPAAKQILPSATD